MSMPMHAHQLAPVPRDVDIVEEACQQRVLDDFLKQQFDGLLQRWLAAQTV